MGRFHHLLQVCQVREIPLSLCVGKCGSEEGVFSTLANKGGG